MKKNKQAFLLIILMSMIGTKTFAHDIAVANADGKTIYYNYINDGLELEVTFQGSSYSAYNEYREDISIPEEVTYMGRTRKVTSIGNNAFRECKYLKSVSIPDNVTKIGTSAFYLCSVLASVEIPNSVSSIGSNAFCGCNALVSINIPTNLTTIEDSAFESCFSLTSLTIPSNIISIGQRSFMRCTGLTSVSISENVTSIGKDAFHNCITLSSITIPNKVTTIGGQAFEGCDALTSVTIPSSVTNIGGQAFFFCNMLTKVIVEDIVSWCGITFEDNSANPLYYAKHLYSDESTEITNLVIPNMVTSIGDFAFCNCNSLTSVTIPNSVNKIGKSAFNFSNTTGDVISIISLIEDPQDINENTFHDDLYNNATLSVPVGTISKYKVRTGWKNFFWIEEGVPANISDTKNEQANELIRYNLSGEMLKQAQRGINIVRMSDGKTKKIVVNNR